MIVAGGDGEVSKVGASIVEHSLDEGIRYGQAKRYSENPNAFVVEIEA